MSLRVGDYRTIYTVDNGEMTVYVIDAGNRGKEETTMERKELPV